MDSPLSIAASIAGILTFLYALLFGLYYAFREPKDMYEHFARMVESDINSSAEIETAISEQVIDLNDRKSVELREKALDAVHIINTHCDAVVTLIGAKDYHKSRREKLLGSLRDWAQCLVFQEDSKIQDAGQGIGTALQEARRNLKK